MGVMKHWCRVGYVDSYRRSFEMLRDNLSPTYENLAKIDIRDSTIIDWDVDEGDHTVKALDENVSVGLGRVYISLPSCHGNVRISLFCSTVGVGRRIPRR